jgi:hypothetical protein
MSVAPTSESVPSNSGISVVLSTTALNDSAQIYLTLDPPTGVFAAPYDRTTVTAGQQVYLRFWPVAGAPLGHKGPVTIIGSNGVETHSVTVDWTTTACVPRSCAEGECGSISDTCGRTVYCGTCAKGLVCSFGSCVLPFCAKPHPCPKGEGWDILACRCMPKRPLP